MSTQKNKRTIYLGLDYSDFTGGITEINRKMGLLDAEFKLAKEQIANYGTEADAAGTKVEYLSQKIMLQEQKVKAAAEAYDKAMTSQTASAKTIDDLDKKLLNERTKLEQLKGSLNDAEKAQKGLTEKTRTFGDTIRDVADKIGIKSPIIEDIAKKFDGVSESVGLAVTAVVGIGKKLTEFATDAASAADDLLTLSAKTGIATEELQKLQYASTFVDVEVSTMTSSIQKLTRNMDEARSGNAELASTFRDLGVRVTDSHGKLKDANTVFYEVIDSLGKMKNETERDAASMKIFGKSAAELNPLIKAGSEEMKRLGKEAEDMGVILGDETVAAYGRLNDAMDRSKIKLDDMKTRLGLALLPVLEAVLDIFTSIPTPVLLGVAAFGAIVAIGLKVATTMKTVAAANAILAASNTMLGATGSAATAGLGSMLGILLAIAAVVGLITFGAVKLSDVTSEASRETQKAVASAQNAADSLAKGHSSSRKGYAKGTQYAEGGEYWVGEAGPEVVELPRGSKVHTAEESEDLRGDTYNIYLNVNAKEIREVDDIINMVRGRKMAMIRGLNT